MMSPFLNAVRLQAQRAVAESVVTRIGQVTNYDPNNYAAKVQFQDDEILTGWLPIASIWIGNGWGLYTPPNIGDMCSVSFINGDLECGYVEARFWNDIDRPLAVPSGECWLVHAKGQSIKLTNDGKLTVSDGQGATVQFDGAGNLVSQANNWTHTGPMTVDGNVQVNGNVGCSQTVTATTDVVGGGKSLKTHVHTGVTTGGGVSGPPQ